MKDVQTHLSFLEAEAIETMREVAKLLKDAGLMVILRSSRPSDPNVKCCEI